MLLVTVQLALLQYKKQSTSIRHALNISNSNSNASNLSHHHDLYITNILFQEIDVGSKIAVGVLGVVLALAGATGAWGYLKYRALLFATRLLRAEQAGATHRQSKYIFINSIKQSIY